MSEAEYKAISNSKNYNLMYFCAKCQPMVGITLRFFNEVRMKQSSMNERLMTVESTIENISRTITQTKTDVPTVRETVGPNKLENRSSGKHYAHLAHLDGRFSLSPRGRPCPSPPLLPV